MINLFTTLIITSLLYLIFKSFDVFRIKTFQAVVFNYFTCVIVGLIFSWNVAFEVMLEDLNWIFLSIAMGILFITTFHLMAWTAQKISVSVSSVSSKMSMILPVLFSFLYLKVDKESLSIYIIGLVLAILSIYWSTKRANQSPESASFLKYALLIFLLTGMVDISVNLSNYLFKHIPHFNQLFPIAVFFMAAFFGATYLGIQLFKKKDSFEYRSIFGGIALGIPNYFSIYFLLQTLSDFDGNGAIVFPVLNIGVIVLTSLLAFAFFKERLSRINILGIVCAIISIVLISYEEMISFMSY